LAVPSRPATAAQALWAAGTVRWDSAEDVVALAMRRLESARLMTVID
jgi:hypothetical protein